MDGKQPEGESKRWLQRLDAGQTLFEEGDQGRRLYALVQGKVEVLRGGERVAVVDVGDTFIGEISALTGRPRSATVRTLEPSTLLVVEDIEELLSGSVKWSLKLATVLAQRLERMNERMQQAERRVAAMAERHRDEGSRKMARALADELMETRELLRPV